MPNLSNQDLKEFYQQMGFKRQRIWIHEDDYAAVKQFTDHLRNKKLKGIEYNTEQVG